MPAQQDLQRLQALREAKRRGMLGPTQSAAVGVLEDRFSEYFKGVGDRAKSVAEPAMTAASAAFAEPVSGLVGLAALPFGTDVSTRAIEKTQDAMTYQPRSEAGQQGLQGLMSVLGPVGEAFEGASSYLGDAAYEATGSPVAGAAAYSVPAMGMELLGLKGTRAASKAGKLGKQLEMGDIGRGNVGANQRGIFAGTKAKTADMDALNKAQEMMAQGASRDEVWDQTGWFKDVDGSWKFEIDDSGARTRDIFKSDPMAREILEEADEVSTDLPYAMSHERFRSAYPDEFADTEVISKPYAQSEGGSYNMGTIKAPTDFRYGDDSFSVNKSTTLHEMQHSVQDTEGFARGGMPSSAKEVVKEMQKKQSELKTKASTMPSSQWRERAAIEKEAADLGRKMRDIKDMTPFEMYRHLAGEAEARNVQTRMNMTPDERRAKAPWETLDVPEDELIVRRSGGVAESASRIPDMPEGRVMNAELGSKLTFVETPDGRVQMYNPNRQQWKDVTDSPMGENIRMKDAEINAAGGPDAYQANIEGIRAQRAAATQDRRAEFAAEPESYKMQHTAPRLDENPSAANLNDVFPDIYSGQAQRLYGTGAPYDGKAIAKIKAMRANPDKQVEIFRAVPEGVEDINAGDWVTTTKEYARDHIGSDEGYRIISKKVKASELANDGNSIHEFGFDPT